MKYFVMFDRSMEIYVTERAISMNPVRYVTIKNVQGEYDDNQEAEYVGKDTSNRGDEERKSYTFVI